MSDVYINQDESDVYINQDPWHGSSCSDPVYDLHVAEGCQVYLIMAVGYSFRIWVKFPS